MGGFFYAINSDKKSLRAILAQLLGPISIGLKIEQE